MNRNPAVINLGEGVDVIIHGSGRNYVRQSFLELDHTNSDVIQFVKKKLADITDDMCTAEGTIYSVHIPGGYGVYFWEVANRLSVGFSFTSLKQSAETVDFVEKDPLYEDGKKNVCACIPKGNSIIRDTKHSSKDLWRFDEIFSIKRGHGVIDNIVDQLQHDGGILENNGPTFYIIQQKDMSQINVVVSRNKVSFGNFAYAH